MNQVDNPKTKTIKDDVVLRVAFERNEPIPISEFYSFCSRSHFYNRYFPAGLPSEKIDGVRCIRPNDFFEFRNKLNSKDN